MEKIKKIPQWQPGKHKQKVEETNEFYKYSWEKQTKSWRKQTIRDKEIEVMKKTQTVGILETQI